MREIEIKAQIDDLEGILEVFKQQNIALSDAVTQHDVVWGVSGEKRGSDSPWLRLRTEKRADVERYLFTLKRSMTGQLDSLEYETEVADPNAVIGMVSELGFVPYSDITKTRRKAAVDNVELCLDEVDGLGCYVELEKLTDEKADNQVIENELWVIMESFGIGREKEITIGYDVMINQKEGRE